MKISLVCGARPNFMKIAPILGAIKEYNSTTRQPPMVPVLVHTGQHYDYEMSRIFFDDLELPEPDTYLGVGSGTHAEQTGKIMIEFEKVLISQKPDLVIVVGDVNSTLAAALAAVKVHIPIAHVEAGLRSYDRAMPEEINRLLTDIISDYLFTTSHHDNDNLKKEGIPDNRIFLVGNVMVDSLIHYRDKAEKSAVLERLGLSSRQEKLAIDDKPSAKPYALLTLHRPDNVDDRDTLLKILEALTEISRRIPIVFPVHPRTKNDIAVFGLEHILENDQIVLTEPLSYLDFLKLEMHSAFVLTDSGGVQAETTILNIPTLTLRDTTEWVVTVTQGTNALVGNNRDRIVEEAYNIIDGRVKTGSTPELWDGKAARRIVEILSNG